MSWRISKPLTPPWQLNLRSCSFDACRVLRGGEGKVLAEDDDGLIGLHSRIVAHLAAGREYSATACALHGARGAFELTLEAGEAPILSLQERTARDLEDARARVKAMEHPECPEHPLLASSLKHLTWFLYSQGHYEAAQPLHARRLRSLLAHVVRELPAMS